MVREETARNVYGAVRVYSDTDCGRTLVIRIIRPIGKIPFDLSVTKYSVISVIGGITCKNTISLCLFVF